MAVNLLIPDNLREEQEKKSAENTGREETIWHKVMEAFYKRNDKLI